MTERVTVIGVGGGDPLDAGARAALSAADLVLATRAELAAVRGLVPPATVVDVLGDTAMDDPEGHRWDLPVDPVGVVVLTPPGELVWRVLRTLGSHLGPERVIAFPLAEAAASIEPDDAAHLPPDRPDLEAFPPDRGEVAAEPVQITVVGLDLAGGAHDEGWALSARAREALRTAGTVAGGQWHLDALGGLLDRRVRRVPLGADLAGPLDELLAADVRTVVLASGDPGFFGIVRALRDRMEAAGVDPERLVVLPGVSSVARVCAEAGESWDDALVVSAHGRDPAPAVNACRRHPKVVVLTAPDFGPAELALALGDARREFVIAERLGLPDERVTRVPADVARVARPGDPNVVLVLDPAAPRAARGRAWPSRRGAETWALPDAAFAARDGMVTKAEVRALVLAWLGPGVGDLVWDVGAGSGSVAVECARLGAAAVAVERDADACRRVRANAERHGVPVAVVEGAAPAVLAALPDPDAVFVGGAGADLPAVLAAVAARGPRVVVATLATLERVAPARAALEAAGLAVDGTLLSAARLAPLGDGTRLAATNPVVVLRGSRSTGEATS